MFNRFSCDPMGVVTCEFASACCRIKSREGCVTSSFSSVDLRMSGLERALAKRTKSSSTFESMDESEGRVTRTLSWAS